MLKHEIKGWSKNQFGNLHTKLAHNPKQIEYVEDKLLSSLDSFHLTTWMTCLLKQREKMMLFNQKYWGKFRRKQWLIHGDRTTEKEHDCQPS